MSMIPDIDEAEEDALLQSDEEHSESEEDSQKDGNENDDLSDGDLNEENEENLLREYVTILTDISSNTLNYNAYINLTEAAHKLGDLEKIRESYTMFAKVFPLAPEIWLKYISIESNLCTSEVEADNVINLYKKALTDYFSVNVAMSFAEFLFKVTDYNKASQIWSELLATYALDCYNGQKFFELYRKFNEEQSTLNNEQKLENYVQSYLKELRIPLYEMENSYIDFKVFYEKNKEDLLKDIVDFEKVDKYYNRAKKDLKKMVPFEERLKNLSSKFYQEKAYAYLDYIKMADEDLEENIIQILYERMVTDCCLNEKCWIEYIDFILKRDEDGKPEELEDFPVFRQSALDINARALRNCTWNYKLYIKKFYILEEIGRSRQEVKETFEKSLEIGYDIPDPYVALWLEYLAYMRRQTNYESDDDIEILRKNFDLCWNTLGKQWGVLADCNCEVLQFWGRLEYGPFQNPEKGKELWNTVMESSDNSLKSALWIEFIHMEMRVNPDFARKLFKKALSFDLDNPYSIVSAWIRFERCNGSQVNLDYCQKYCENFLNDVDRRYKFKTQKGKQDSTEKKGLKRKSATVSEPPNKKPKNEPSTSSFNSDNPFVKPVLPRPQSNTSRIVKDHENDEIDTTKDHLRIFLSNLDYSITENEIREGLSELTIINVDLIKAANGRSRGFGYAELSSNEQVQKALQLDGKSLKGRPLYISSVLRDKEKRQKFKYSEGVEPKKLFIKGLPHDTTKEELQQLFEKYGKIYDIRIVYHKSGRPKGIAYVEYEDETSASVAVLKLDGFDIRDHKINIAISAPPAKSSTTKSQPINIRMLGIGSTKKPRMNLIPSSVQRNISGSTSTSTTTTQSNGNAPLKSNDDFRKLLNK